MANYDYIIGPWVRRSDLFGQPWGPPVGARGGLDIGSLVDCAQSSGDHRQVGVFWGPPGFAGSDWALLGRGDCRDIRASGAMLSAIQSVAKYRPAGDTLADLLADLLIGYSDADGQAGPMPLMPDRDGLLALHLVGHSRVWAQPFAWGKHSHTQKIKRVLQNILRDVRAQARAGKWIGPAGVDRDGHRRYLTGLLADYGCPAADILPPGWERDEMPLPKRTTYSDNLNRADGTTIGNTLTWTEVAAGWVTYGNAVWLDNTAEGTCRAESDLSSSDHYSQVNTYLYPGVTVSNDHWSAAACRFASAANTCYVFIPYRPNGTGYLDKIVSGTRTSLGNAAFTWAQGTLTKISASSSTITGYYGGTQIVQLTDTAITGNTRCGFAGGTANRSSYNPYVDNFECGDLATAYTRSVSDSVGGADSATRVFAVNRSAAEGVGAADSLAGQAAYARAMSELAAAADAVSLAAAFLRAADDFEGVADSLVRSAAWYWELSDSVGLADTSAASLGIYRSIADNAAVADAVACVAAFLRTCSEPVGLADAAARIAAYARTRSESVAGGDQVASVLSALAKVTNIFLRLKKGT